MYSNFYGHTISGFSFLRMFEIPFQIFSLKHSVSDLNSEI